MKIKILLITLFLLITNKLTAESVDYQMNCYKNREYCETIVEVTIHAIKYYDEYLKGNPDCREKFMKALPKGLNEARFFSKEEVDDFIEFPIGKLPENTSVMDFFIISNSIRAGCE